MKTHVGSKVYSQMPDGRIHPAIVISEETSEEVVVIDRNTNLPVTIIVTRADMLSQRENRAGETYPSITNEVVQYGRKIVTTPRFDSYVGLDADEDGKVLTLAEAMKAHSVTHGAWLAEQFAGRKGTSVSAADV